MIPEWNNLSQDIINKPTIDSFKHSFFNQFVHNYIAHMHYYLKMLPCDWACENRACGLKYTMLFDETYLNTEM